MARRAPIRRRLRYWFDNTMSKGTASLIGWLSLVSVLLIVSVTAALRAMAPGPSTLVGQLWSTFIKTFGLSVPDSPDVAWRERAIWFVVALAGIFVVSTLVGLLSSGLNRKLEQLRKGRSFVAERNHTIILGWSDQVFALVAELVEANKSRRRAAVAILAEQDKVVMEDRLRHRLGDTHATKLVCRTGSPLDLTDLQMVNPNAASAIIIVAPQNTTAEDADSYVIKALLAISRGPAFRGHPHHVIASVRDGRNLPVARLAGGGDSVILNADEISARLIVQTARQPGLSIIYQDLLDFDGNEFYVTSEPKVVGMTFGQTLLAYRGCCPVGIVYSDGSSTLNPAMETVIEPGHRLVLLAEDDSKTKFAPRQSLPINEAAIVHSFRGPRAPEHTLILGWNDRGARVIEQLDVYVSGGSIVDIISGRSDVDATMSQVSPRLRRVSCRIKDGDTRDRSVLESLDISAYDNVIVLSDDQLDPLTADSRVLVTLLHLRDILAARGGRVGSIVSEMRDERDRAIASLTKADDFVVSEQLVSLLMTQIAENKHLESVFADLFDADGAEIYVRPASYYVRPTTGLTFATVVDSARRRNEVAIGYRVAEPGDGHGVVLNPDKAAPMPLIDRVIVLATS